jgi:predicted Zn finger-like uncharacterized protein
LYTQCSKCETIFKLSAEVLRAASGQVRCGRCGEVFNALARLAEDASAFEAGESSLELETRADSILGSAGALRVAQAIAKEEEEFAPPGVEIAQLQVLDWTPDDQELLQDDPLPADPLPADPPPAAKPPATAQLPAGSAADRLMEFTLPPGELDRIFVESKTYVEPKPDVEPLGEPMLEEFEQLDPVDPMERRRFRWWLGAAIASALLLIIQVVHQNRAWLADHVHGPVGDGVRMLYGALGAPLAPPVNLSAYQLRQWGVTGDPEANGKLRVRASILNASAQLQPYPLLRVTLADRFGNGIGRRDFEAPEYLGKPTARLLAPGERVDATLDILDPGKNAEGFEIDVCLRGTDQKIACANDVAPQIKQ